MLFSSCESIFEKEENEVITNYNLLFDYLSTDYAYRDDAAISIDELYDEYIQRIIQNPSEQTFANVLLDIEQDLSDPHFQPPAEAYQLTGRNQIDYSLLRLESERDAKGIYPIEVDFIGDGIYFAYGIVISNPKIGYLRINNLSSSIGGTGRLQGNPWREQIEDILRRLKNRGVNRMIIDVRSSAGGSNYNGLYIANRFINKEAVYMLERYLLKNGKTQDFTYSVKPEGNINFRTGKVALLTNNLTCSGGELFTLAMLQRDNLVHIGTPTRGCAGSVVTRDLPNGWNFTITSSQTFFPDGKSYFRVGIRPQIIARNDESYGFTTIEDSVVKRAIKELR
ncbi:MAG: S41 family peptidase [Bacteroidota bacterium]